MSSIHYTFPSGDGTQLHGVLHLPKECSDTANRLILLIVHGTFADSSYQPLVAISEALPIPSFRIDLRGCGQSSGHEEYGARAIEIADIFATVHYLNQTLGYAQIGLLGHSKGGNLLWRCVGAGLSLLPVFFISVSSRFVMNRDNTSRFSAAQIAQLKNGGDVEWRNRDGRVIIVSSSAFYEYRSIDYGLLSESVSNMIPIYIVHGDRDRVVPYEDAELFSTHAHVPLIRIPEAGHSFRDPTALVNVIVDIVNSKLP